MRPTSLEDLGIERKPFYTTAEVARVLKVSEQHILDRIHAPEDDPQYLYAIALDPATYRVPVGAFAQLLGISPRIERVPQTEWHYVLEHLGQDLVRRLLGIAPASVRRYAMGQRRTPDGVAERLHFLALVTADLSGSYNDFGVRGWFERPRPQLGMKSPVQLLRGEWHADSDGARRVRELAHALTGPLGT